MIDVNKLEFINFLPNNMKGVDRWREFVSVYQDVVGEFVTDNIDPMLDQFNKDLMTQQDFINLSINFGWNIIYGDGWTSNLEYFKRQCLTIVPRIVNKTTRNAYWYNFWPYNLIGDVIPFFASDEFLAVSLEPFWNFWELNEDPVAITYLDSGLDNILYYVNELIESETFLFDGESLNQSSPVYSSPQSDQFPLSYLDNDNPPNLDDVSRISTITRSILVTYQMPLIEDSTQFLSDTTLRAFYGDTQRLRRATERLYYEPVLDFQYSTSGVITTTFNNYEETETAEQKTILIGSVEDLENVSTIILGSGQVENIETGPYCVSGIVLTIPSGEIEYNDTDFSVPYIRKRTLGKDIIPNFTEACFLTADSGTILYSQFPAVNYYKDMYCGIRFNLTEV
jgi:hypothetical protein